MMPILAIAEKEVRDARRQRWFLLLAAIFAALALAFSLLGLAGLGTVGVAGFGRTAASLVNLVMLIVPLMGLTLGAHSLASEREQGTLATLLAQPLRASEVLLGKFLGLAWALTIAVLVGFGLSGLAIAGRAGSAQVGDYGMLLLLTALLGLGHLSLGLLLSTLAPKGSTALSLALLLWLTLVFLSDLGLVGTAMVLRLPPWALLTLALLNPVQEFKVAAIQVLHGNLELLGAAGLYANEVLGPFLVPLLLTALGLWVLLPLALALILFPWRGNG